MKWGDTVFGATVGIGIMFFLIASGCGIAVKISNEKSPNNVKIQQHE